MMGAGVWVVGAIGCGAHASAQTLPETDETETESSPQTTVVQDSPAEASDRSPPKNTPQLGSVPPTAQDSTTESTPTFGAVGSARPLAGSSKTDGDTMLVPTGTLPHAVANPELGSPPYDTTFRLTRDVWFKSWAFVQVRWTENYRYDTEGVEGDAFTQAVNIPRVRFHLAVGVTPWLDFLVRPGIQSGGNLVMEQAYANIYVGDFRLRVGQFFAPLVMEEDVAPNRLTSSDFSQVANTFGAGQVPGVQALWSVTPYINVYGIVFNGLRTGFGEVNDPLNAQYAFLGRIEARPTHNQRGWGLFSDRSSWRGNDFGVRVGASGHYQKMTSSFEPPGSTAATITADANVKGNGWGLLANGVWQQVNDTGPAFNAYGFFAQGSLFLTRVLEVAAAYDGVYTNGRVYPTNPDAGPTTNYNSVIGTFNWYITPNENRAKLQMDAVFAFNPIATSIVTPAPNVGLINTQVGGQQALRINLTVGY